MSIQAEDADEEGEKCTSCGATRWRAFVQYGSYASECEECGTGSWATSMNILSEAPDLEFDAVICFPRSSPSFLAELPSNLMDARKRGPETKIFSGTMAEGYPVIEQLAQKGAFIWVHGH